jgi:hypothetical protein
LESREFQKVWDELASSASLNRLIKDDVADVDRARLIHVSRKDAGFFLEALPSPKVGTLLSNDQLRACVALRLGIPLFDEHICACGITVDTKGLHKLCCKKLALSKIARHNQINDVLSRALRQAGISNRLEPENLCTDSGIRPDGLTVMPWSFGRSLIWDVTVRDTYAPTHLAQSSRLVGHASSKAEKEKRRHYLPLLDSYIFIPFAIETSGVWGGEALEFSKQIGARITQLTGEDRATAFLRQRVAIEVARGTALLLMEGLTHSDELAELFLL